MHLTIYLLILDYFLNLYRKKIPIGYYQCHDSDDTLKYGYQCHTSTQVNHLLCTTIFGTKLTTYTQLYNLVTKNETSPRNKGQIVTVQRRRKYKSVSALLSPIKNMVSSALVLVPWSIVRCDVLCTS